MTDVVDAHVVGQVGRQFGNDAGGARIPIGLPELMAQARSWLGRRRYGS